MVGLTGPADRHSSATSTRPKLPPVRAMWVLPSAKHGAGEERTRPNRLSALLVWTTKTRLDCSLYQDSHSRPPGPRDMATPRPRRLSGTLIAFLAPTRHSSRRSQVPAFEQ